MDVSVKLVGTFAKYAPDGSQGNEISVGIDDGMTVGRLTQNLGLPADQPYMVSVNDELVPIVDRGSRSLEAGDSVKIIPPLKGG